MQPINPGNHPSKSLNECNPKSPLETSLNADPPTPFCGTGDPSLRDTDPVDLSWLTDYSTSKLGFGHHQQCDPMQSGLIHNNENNRFVINRYSKAIRGCDEAMQDLFANIAVRDDNGKLHPVPILWGTQERAVGVILQDNVRKESTVVDRLKLPLLSIHQSDFQFDQQKYMYHGVVSWLRDELGRPGFHIKEGRYERDTVFGVARGIPVTIGYELTAWTGFMEDIDQIIEQIILKFSPIAYITVRGVNWETTVSLESIANNLDVDPGESQRVIKFQFNLKVETYIPQPIVRRKAVLKTRVETFNSIEPSKATELLGRLEEVVEELNDRD